jgi:Fe-S-cluster containining protein
MAEFVCTRCGKCCVSLGRHIKIERSISPIQHYCRIGITGEIIPVIVAPEHREIHAHGERAPGWCPFLRRAPDSTFTCTIHGVRPRICREFRCKTMVIYTTEGREAGSVTGRASLSTEDSRLETLWNELAQSGKPDGPAFFDRIKRELARHGYRAETLS